MWKITQVKIIKWWPGWGSSSDIWEKYPDTIYSNKSFLYAKSSFRHVVYSQSNKIDWIMPKGGINVYIYTDIFLMLLLPGNEMFWKGKFSRWLKKPILLIKLY